MRDEREIIHSVLALAERDDGVRAVIRTDLLPVREYLHSCNFIFVVNNIDRYDGDVFRDSLGDRILLFRADRSYPELFPGAKAHLMVFDDGATIVVQAMGRDAFLERINAGHEGQDVWIGDTFQKLLDKDGLLTVDDRLEERQTRFSEIPTREAFADACDEFWWV
ncbi:MAG: aminoglycoside 6-adenylyltransferase, partial [Clostridia bacterium]|nr:aminoglycoside 6-adenylyltransferase [Clostridia bacterium]